MAVVLLNVSVVSENVSAIIFISNARKKEVYRSSWRLSKASGCLNYEILIANMKTYGVSLPVSKMMHDFVLHRKQRTKISSSDCEIVFGILIF